MKNIKAYITTKQKDKGLFLGGYIEINNKKISIGSNHKNLNEALNNALKIINLNK